MAAWWQSHSGHIQLHLNTLGQCTFVPPSSCPLLSIDSEVMMQLLNTKWVTVTQLYVTDDAASEHRARVAGCDKARPPPNAGCSESPMGLRRWQWVMGVAANELAALNPLITNDAFNVKKVNKRNTSDGHGLKWCSHLARANEGWSFLLAECRLHHKRYCYYLWNLSHKYVHITCMPIAQRRQFSKWIRMLILYS